MEPHGGALMMSDGTVNMKKGQYGRYVKRPWPWHILKMVDELYLSTKVFVCPEGDDRQTLSDSEFRQIHIVKQNSLRCALMANQIEPMWHII